MASIDTHRNYATKIYKLCAQFRFSMANIYNKNNNKNQSNNNLAWNKALTERPAKCDATCPS